MKWLVFALAVATAPLFAADAETTRKAAPDKFQRAAGESFAKAAAAHDRGDLRVAENLYKASLELVAHPNTAFNLGEVYAARGMLYDAVIHYELYLALDPEAADRAKVRALITELSTRRGTLKIHTANRESSVLDLTEAYVLVDGAIVAKPGTIKAAADGITVPVLHGSHQIDAITSVTYDDGRVDPKYGENVDVRMVSSRAAAGNVVIRSSSSVRISLAEKVFEKDRDRVDLAPGKHVLRVFDDDYECPPIEIDVPKGETVLYLRVTPTLGRRVSQSPKGCRKLAIQKHLLAF